MMTMLDRQVGRARRRLTHNVLFQWLAFGVLVAAGLWGIAIIVDRLFAFGMPLQTAGLVAAGLAATLALVGMFVRRPNHLQAAVALDEAAGLKERLSTALALRLENDPFVMATVRDAEKTAGSVHVPTHIRYEPPRLWPWSTASTLVALILLWAMPTVDLFAGEPEEDEEPIVPREVVKAEQIAIETEFEKKIETARELAQKDQQLKDILKDIEPLDMPDAPEATPEDIRREALKRIDDLRDRLDQRKKDSDEDTLKQTKRMFQQLEPPSDSHAEDKLSKSLAKGDFKGAQEALREMASEIEEAAKNTDDPESQKKLADMEQQLRRLADRLAKMGDTQELQKELQEKSGLTEEQAKKLLEQLANADPKQIQKELQKQLGGKGLSQDQLQKLAQKIRQQQKKLKQQQQAKKNCKNLSDALKQAANGCQQCQQPGSSGSGSSQANNALSDAASQLSDMEMAEQMMNELEAQLSDIDNMRDDVCEGNMCPNGNGQGRRGGRPPQVGSQGPNEGLGLGAKIGKEKVAYKRDATKAKTRYQGGTIIGRMLVEGPQVRGEVTADEVAADASAVRDALDAVEREEVPRQYQRTLRLYFDRLAGLMSEQQLEEKEE